MPTSSTKQVYTDPPVAAMERLLKHCQRVLVASHIDPDGDALGSQLAFADYLRTLGKQVLVVRESSVPAKYRFLPGADSIIDVASCDSGERVDTAVILECPNRTRIGRVGSLLAPNAAIINIDHHQDNEVFGAVNWIDTGASSVGEMIFEYFQLVGFEISPQVAEQLYTAILTDTGRFRYSSTSARTMAIAGELLRSGADSQKICDSIYYDLRPSTVKLMGKVLNSIEFADNGRICLLTLTSRMLEECGADQSESEGIIDFALFSRGVQVGVLLKSGNSTGTRVSLRSRGDLNVAVLAASFGGGGHPNAAGCEIPLPLSEARAELIKLLQEARHEQD